MNFTCVILGNIGVGKSVFINRHQTGHYDNNHIPTPTETLTPLNFHTQQGPCTFNVHEAGLPPKADCAIIMFDVHDATSYHNVLNHYQQLMTKYGRIPMVICGNKVEQPGRQVIPQNIHVHRQLKCIYFDISTKSNYNFEKPFLFLLRQLVHPEVTDYTKLCNIELGFIANPALFPPVITGMN